MSSRPSLDLLVEIVRCPEVDSAGDPRHPCHEITASQQERFGPHHTWQPPTPWIGVLDQAPILFVGSNPNIGGLEFYPTVDSPDGEFIDFFDRAFEGFQIKDGIRAKQANGTWGNWVRTWAGVRLRAEELLERQPVPGVDYALTEIVKCRSSDEIGVGSARSMCSGRFLDRTFACSPAQVVVALGAHTREALVPEWTVGDPRVVDTELGGRPRLLALMPHPTAFGPKSFASIMGDEQLASLRARLAERRDRTNGEIADELGTAKAEEYLTGGEE